MPTQQVSSKVEPQKGHSSVSDDEDSLESPVKVVEGEHAMEYANMLSFLSEEVDIMILPSFNPDDTTKLVDISVNGKSFYFIKGEYRKAPRYVLEILATAKKEAWTFGYRRAPGGATVQTQDSSWVLRYPHQFKDTDPKGVAWYDSIKDSVR